MTKIFHVGITAPTYSSDAMTKAFKEVFGDVLYFDWQFHRYNYGTVMMQTILLKEASEYKPDIIFLHLNHNNEAISLENYEKLSKIATVIAYTEDVRDDISWVKQINHFVKFTIFTNKEDKDNLKAPAVYLPVSYNDLWYKKQPRTKTYYGDIVFLGNNYVGTNLNFPNAEERQQMCAVLKKEFGGKFQAYGGGQDNSALNPQQAIECYNNATIAICHNNFTRRGYQSDRGLNSMGCGCATIMHHYDGIEEHFPNMIGGSWKSLDSLIALCHTYLENSFITNQLKTYQHGTVLGNHTWLSRAKTLKHILEI